MPLVSRDQEKLILCYTSCIFLYLKDSRKLKNSRELKIKKRGNLIANRIENVDNLYYFVSVDSQ